MSFLFFFQPAGQPFPFGGGGPRFRQPPVEVDHGLFRTRRFQVRGDLGRQLSHPVVKGRRIPVDPLDSLPEHVGLPELGHEGPEVFQHGVGLGRRRPLVKAQGRDGPAPFRPPVGEVRFGLAGFEFDLPEFAFPFKAFPQGGVPRGLALFRRRRMAGGQPEEVVQIHVLVFRRLTDFVEPAAEGPLMIGDAGADVVPPGGPFPEGRRGLRQTGHVLTPGPHLPGGAGRHPGRGPERFPLGACLCVGRLGRINRCFELRQFFRPAFFIGLERRFPGHPVGLPSQPVREVVRFPDGHFIGPGQVVGPGNAGQEIGDRFRPVRALKPCIPDQDPPGVPPPPGGCEVRFRRNGALHLQLLKVVGDLRQPFTGVGHRGL